MIDKTCTCYGKHYDDIHISCHGGITYSRNYLPYVDDQKGDWWIGFDCGHYGDGYDVECTLKYFKIKIDNPTGLTAKTCEFAANECMKIVDQLNTDNIISKSNNNDV